MNQVFQNLLSNAIKYRNGRTPKIHVGCEVMGEDWRFFVRDNGIGIPEQELNRIFIVFQRLHTRSEYEGSGIGLATCRKIVEAFGGKAWAKSKLGEGSTFYFTIPKEPKDARGV